MAKGSAMGLWKGKKGSSVFYQIKNSNSLQKQGVRERNYEPANPKSARQAGQRMRMYPAQAVYGVLKETIERSWQGVKYGQMTRQAYLKAALRTEFFPAVTKGDGVIVPGPYQIAKGSLGEIKATLTENGVATFDFNFATSGTDTTVGALSAALLEANPWLREGDQVTTVLCYTGDSSIVRFNWFVGSIYIDPNDTTNLSPEDSSFVPFGFEVAFGTGLSYSPIDEQFIYAAACIVSREGTTPLRTNATLSVNAAALPDYYDANARSRAQRSYMNPLTVQETDWPVDPGEGGGGTSGTIMITASATNENGTVTGGGSYLPGELVSLVATPNQGYELQGWYTSLEDAEAGTNRISTAGILTFTAGDSSAFGGATTFYARFTLQG